MDNTKMVRRNNISISGDHNKVMLFAHGYGCDQNMWRFIAPAFADKFKIVLFDHVGSGKSDKVAYDYTKYSNLQGYADDVLGICETLHLTNVTFVGHSVSAMIGLLAAVKQPDFFEQIIMVGPSPCYLNKEDYFGGFSKNDLDELLHTLNSNYLGWSSTMAPVIMGNPDKPALAKELENSFCNNDPAIAKHFAMVTFNSDNRKDLAKLSINSLILQCTSDIIAPQLVGEYVAGQIKKSTYHLLKSTGHCPHLSAPDETIEAIKNYLERN